MNDVERALNKWLNTQFSDYYIMHSTAFEGGFKVVEHEAPTINHAFYRLLCNLFPVMKDAPVPYGVSEEHFTIWPDGVQVTIKPFDDEIHHTQYVKEDN